MKNEYRCGEVAAARMLRAPVGSCGLFVLALLGCDDRGQIVSYDAPKDPQIPASAVEQVRSQQPAAPLAWDLPAGWQQQKGGGPMRFATITAAQSSFAVAVTKLPPQAGSVLANVNRWRGQLELAPVEPDELSKVVRPLESLQLPGTVVDLFGPAKESQAPQRILVAIFALDDATWFFKAHASNDVVQQHELAFMEFVGSVRKEIVQNTVPDPGTADQFATDPLRGLVPAGWQRQLQPPPPRLAGFRFGSGAMAGEMAVTRFPGDVGGEIANVNRWRAQVGLPHVTVLDGLDRFEMAIGGNSGTVYRFFTPGASGDRPGIVVAMVELNGETWFFKMTGPAELLRSQYDAFASFIESLSFE